MSKKERNKDETDSPVENASPVCYINSDELRPEYKEETNEREVKKKKKQCG